MERAPSTSYADGKKKVLPERTQDERMEGWDGRMEARKAGWEGRCGLVGK